MAAKVRDLSHTEHLPDDALISIPTMATLTGEAVSTTWRKLAQQPGYPKTIKLGNRCTRVRLGDVRRLLKEGVPQ